MLNKTESNLLVDIALATGVTDNLQGLNRNQLLTKIAKFYEDTFTRDTMLPILRYIDQTLAASPVKILSRNQHLKNICSSLLETDAPSGLTRNQYLELWLENIGITPVKAAFTAEFTNEYK